MIEISPPRVKKSRQRHCYIVAPNYLELLGFDSVKGVNVSPGRKKGGTIRECKRGDTGGSVRARCGVYSERGRSCLGILPPLLCANVWHSIIFKLIYSTGQIMVDGGRDKLKEQIAVHFACIILFLPAPDQGLLVFKADLVHHHFLKPITHISMKI